MKINSNDFQVKQGKRIDLSKWPTRVRPLCKSEKKYQKLLRAHVTELSSLQNLHYASNKSALLLAFQGMDAAGKDAAIRHVMSGVNPQGCEVFNFKQPSAEELEHDFLWRTTFQPKRRSSFRIAFSLTPIRRAISRWEYPLPLSCCTSRWREPVKRGRPRG